jgi:hypothetical protein
MPDAIIDVVQSEIFKRENANERDSYITSHAFEREIEGRLKLRLLLIEREQQKYYFKACRPPP